MTDLNSMLAVSSITLLALAFMFLALATAAVKIAKEYERGVVFRLGRLIPLKGPGLFFVIPGVDRVTKVDLRVNTLVVPQQEVITSDNVTVKVNAVIFFQVMDAQAAIVRVVNFYEATSQIAQTTLRAVLGQSSLDELLGSRDKINAKLQAIIDRQTEPWGIKVGTVELKDAQLADSMVRALARQAEAEREKRAKIIATDGEFQAAQVLANAAEIISTQYRRHWPSGTCRPCSTWAPTRIRRSCFRSRSSSFVRSWPPPCR